MKSKKRGPYKKNLFNEIEIIHEGQVIKYKLRNGRLNGIFDEDGYRRRKLRERLPPPSLPFPDYETDESDSLVFNEIKYDNSISFDQYEPWDPLASTKSDDPILNVHFFANQVDDLIDFLE